MSRASLLVLWLCSTPIEGFIGYSSFTKWGRTSSGERAYHPSPLQASSNGQSIFGSGKAMGSNSDGVAPFEQLQRMDERIRILKDNEVDYLLGFWNEELSCFSITPSAQTRVSITSTSFCCLSILDNQEAWQGLAGYDVSNRINLKEVRDALMQAPWSFDPFQTPVVFSVLGRLRGSPLARAKFRRALETLLDFRPCRSMGPFQQHSAYVYYWTAHALWQLLSDPDTVDILEGSNKLNLIQTHVLETQAVASDEVCRQLAYFAAGDLGTFDVIKLAYSLCTYYEISEEATPYVTAEGLATNATRLSMKIVEQALEVIFSQMSEDGLWRKGEPIYSSHREMNGRDIGNAYVFAYDVLGTILHVFQQEPLLFVPYVTHLERSLKWAEDNMLFDVTGLGPGGRVLKGWRSNHLRNEGKKGPVAWCTAQTFVGLGRMRKVVKALLAKDILIEFGGLEVSGPNPNQWKRLLDSSLLLQGKPRSLKDTLERRFLLPLATKEAMLSGTQTGTQSFTKVEAPLYSGILFGPPGTAKTSIVTAIAYYLGWSFVTIDTADFLAYGLQNIAARMTYVFDRLKLLEHTVILFDEIEEFCLDREDKSLSMESRMLTTAMLTQLNDLRRKQKCLFFIATNRLRSFDAAVIRPGRFDALVFVGTPNLEARLRRFHDLLASNGLDAPSIAHYETVVRPFLTERWEEQLQFFNFAENEAFLVAVMGLCLSGNLTPASLSEVLESASDVVTIRGTIREEYLASQRLSRF